MAKNDKDHSKPNVLALTVLVAGRPVQVQANVNAPLRTVLNKALEESENEGQAPENWEMRNEAGNLLDLDRKVGDLDIAPGSLLSASLRAGAAG